MQLNRLLYGWLEELFERTKDRRVKKGETWDLTFDEYVELWDEVPGRLNKCAKWYLDGILKNRLASPEWGYVLSWRSYTAKSSGLVCKANSIILPRAHSVEACKIKSGEVMRPDHKANIGLALVGKSQSPEHVGKRAEAQRGVKRGPMSQEHKDAISAAKRARNAEKRAAQAGD